MQQCPHETVVSVVCANKELSTSFTIIILLSSKRRTQELWNSLLSLILVSHCKQMNRPPKNVVLPPIYERVPLRDRLVALDNNLKVLDRQMEHTRAGIDKRHQLVLRAKRIHYEIEKVNADICRILANRRGEASRRGEVVPQVTLANTAGGRATRKDS